MKLEGEEGEEEYDALRSDVCSSTTERSNRLNFLTISGRIE